jgi:hypothetical protein
MQSLKIYSGTTYSEWQPGYNVESVVFKKSIPNMNYFDGKQPIWL